MAFALMAAIGGVFGTGPAVAQEIQTRGFNDKFIQRIDKQYGSLWECAVLVPTTDGNLRGLAARIVEPVQEQAVQTKRTFASLIVMVLVIVVLYFFLNAVTRGYFTWKLRAGAVVLAIVGLLLAWFVSLRMSAVSMHDPQIHSHQRVEH